MERQEYLKAFRLEECNWWYAARRSLVILLLEKHLKSKKPGILELGCGSGKTIEELSSQGFECTGLDSSSEAVAFCKKRNIKALKKDALEMSFGSEFGAVLALDLLEHVGDGRALLKKAFQVLKNGGLLVVTVPAFGFLWGPHDILCHHKRRYRKTGLVNALQEAGFKVEFSSYWNFSFFVPSAIAKLLKRAFSGKKAKSDLFRLPGPVNSAMRLVLSVENRLLLAGIPMPFGTSVICVARKKA